MRLKFAVLRLAAALAITGAASPSLFAADRQLQNAWAVGNEVKLAPGVNPALVKEYFPSFYDYLDIALSPSFGNMVAEQMFRMWDGMRKAGTLGPMEKFTIAEFGAGDGAMAESVLDYIDQQAATNSDPRWREFQQQVVYACYDRSPALSEIQRQRNARFGARFEARHGDATDPAATIPR